MDRDREEEKDEVDLPAVDKDGMVSALCLLIDGETRRPAAEDGA
jgi:hypothetical protein